MSSNAEAWFVHALVSSTIAAAMVRTLDSRVMGGIWGYAFGTGFVILMYGLGADPFYAYFARSWSPLGEFGNGPLNWTLLWPASAALVTAVVARLVPRRFTADAEAVRHCGERYRESVTAKFRHWLPRFALAIGALGVIGGLAFTRDVTRWEVVGFSFLGLIGILAIPPLAGLRALIRDRGPLAWSRLLDEGLRRAMRMMGTWILGLVLFLAVAWWVSTRYLWVSVYADTCRICGVYSLHRYYTFPERRTEELVKSGRDFSEARFNEPHEHRWRGPRCVPSYNIWGEAVLYATLGRGANDE